GRKPGSRNKLAAALVDALHDDFTKYGVAAIEKVRAEDPASYLRIITAILPKELDAALSVSIGLSYDDGVSFAEAFRFARQAIGAEVEPVLELEADVEE